MKLVKVNGARVFNRVRAEIIAGYLNSARVCGYYDGWTGFQWQAVPICGKLSIVECIGQGGSVVGHLESPTEWQDAYLKQKNEHELQEISRQFLEILNDQ